MGGRCSSAAPGLCMSVERFGCVFIFSHNFHTRFSIVCVFLLLLKGIFCAIFIQEALSFAFCCSREVPGVVAAGTALHITLTGTQCQTSRQSNRFLAVCICDPEHQPPVPFSANLLGIRSNPSEGLRIRCLEKKCCHRSAAELSAAEILIADCAGQAPDVRSEITPDDLEEPEDTFEEEAGEAFGGGAEASRDLVQELWPHAAPRRYWETMLDLIGGQGSHALVVGTTSAHPALILAARGKGLQARL